MVYLDYAANCPVNEDILNKFNEDAKKYYANPNSTHKAGIECKEIINDISNKIKDILNIDNYDVIYTSGASESNNLAIKGIVEANNIKHIIISPFEHSSIVAPCQYLQSKGIVKVDVVNIDENGSIDLEHLKSLINNEKTLVSIISVESETGLILNINKISDILKDYENVIFHTDATQAIGKINMNFNDIDLFTFAPHKFFGLNGVGVLIKKENIKLLPMIHGGKSTTKYRSGTPNLPFITSVYNSLYYAINNMENNNEYLINIKNHLIDSLQKYEKVKINDINNNVDSTLNISVLGVSSKYFSEELSKKDIYISTSSACSSDNSLSKAVYAITKNEEISSSTLRISFSVYTSMSEIDKFLLEFDKIYNNVEKKL